MQHILRKLGQVTLLAALLVVWFVGPAMGHETGHEHPHTGGGFGDSNTSGGDLEVRAMTWVPVGGVDLGEDDCNEESGLQTHIRDDFDFALTAGYHLVDPVNAQVLNNFVLSGAFGLDSDTRLFSETGRWFLYNCGDQFFLFAEGGPPITFDGMILDVINQLDPPDPPLALTPDHGRHVVQMASWFAIDPAYWTERRVALAEAGRFFVQAELVATQIRWNPGDGQGAMDCFNPGTIWNTGLPETANDCEYVYKQPSINPPTNKWDLTGSVMFEVVDVQTNPELNPADFGPWPPVVRTSTETIEVLEIQAVSRATP